MLRNESGRIGLRSGGPSPCPKRIVALRREAERRNTLREASLERSPNRDSDLAHRRWNCLIPLLGGVARSAGVGGLSGEAALAFCPHLGTRNRELGATLVRTGLPGFGSTGPRALRGAGPPQAHASYIPAFSSKSSISDGEYTLTCSSGKCFLLPVTTGQFADLATSMNALSSGSDIPWTNGFGTIVTPR